MIGWRSCRVPNLFALAATWRSLSTNYVGWKASCGVITDRVGGQYSTWAGMRKQQTKVAPNTSHAVQNVATNTKNKLHQSATACGVCEWLTSQRSACSIENNMPHMLSMRALLFHRVLTSIFLSPPDSLSFLQSLFCFAERRVRKNVDILTTCTNAQYQK